MPGRRPEPDRDLDPVALTAYRGRVIGTRLRPLLIAIGLAALILVAVAGCSQRASATVGWGVFLDNISHGQVAKVVQQGATMTVTAIDGEVYTVTAPGNPDVNLDYLQTLQIAAAAGGPGHTFDQANYTVVPVQDNSWIGLLLTFLLPLVIVGIYLAVLVPRLRLAQKQAAARVAPPPPSPADRLRQLEDARNARLITDDEYAAKRAKILDEM